MAEEFRQDIIVSVEGEQELRQLTRDEQDLLAATQNAGKAAERAAKQSASREAAASRLHRRLVELHRAEIKEERAVAEGVKTNAQAMRQGERRRQQIDRISRALAQKKLAEDKASRSVNEHVASLGGSKQVMDAAAESGTRFSGVLGGLRTQALGLVAALVGATGLLSALQKSRQEIEENAAAANRMKEAQLDLLFLRNDVQPEDLQMTKDAARLIGGKDALLDTNAAFALLLSQTPGMPEAKRRAIYREAVESKLTTSASLTETIPFYTGNIPFVEDPNELQGMYRKAQELSPEASPRKLARLSPRVMQITAEPDVDVAPADAMGFLVKGLELTKGDPDSGATHTKNFLLRLRGRQTPEGEEILERLNASREKNLHDQVENLKTALESGQTNLAELQAIFGMETIQVALGQIRQYDSTQDYIKQIRESSSDGKDPTADALREIYGGDEQLSFMQKIKQAEAELEILKSEDINAQRIQLGRTLFEGELQRRGMSKYRRDLWLLGYDTLTGGGASPEWTLDFIVPDDKLIETYEDPYKGTDQTVVDRMNELLPNLNVQSIGADVEAAESSGRQVNIRASFSSDSNDQGKLGQTTIINNSQTIAEYNQYGVDPITDIRNPEEQD